MAPKKNGRRGGRRRTAEQMDRDARALAMHCEGKGYPEIAEKCGWKNRVSAYEAVRRALMDRQRTSFEQIDQFALAVARVQKAIAACQKIIDGQHFVVSATGKVATDPATGEPVLDPGPAQRALTEQRHLFAELNKLEGNYAPTKQRVEVVTDDVVQREIDQLTKELAKSQTDRSEAHPG